MRVSSESKRITDLMDQVTDGVYRVPEFQRDFVWDTGRISMFFDSILRGYPVGSIIFWCPQNEKFECIENIGGVDVSLFGEIDSTEKETYILDGRQRITSMISVLHPKGDNFDRFFYNLEDDSIETRQRNCRFDPKLLKLGEAYDPVLLLNHIDRIKHAFIEESLKDRYIEKAKSVNKIINRYAIGTVTVQGGEIQDAAEVFSRLNSQGQKISEDYMIQALAYNKNNGFLFGNEITEIIRSLDIYNFENISRDYIFKCVYNYIDKPFFDGRIKDILAFKDNLPEIMNELGKDLDRLVKFLYNDCGIIDSRLLPYGNQFIFLSYYFRINKELEDRQKKELIKWFFYTTYTSHFTGQSLSQTRKEWVKFRDFSNQKCETPLYMESKGDNGSAVYDLSALDFSEPKGFAMGRVRSNAFAFSYILRKEKISPDAKLEFFNLPGVSPRTFGSSFICTSKREVRELKELLMVNNIVPIMKELVEPIPLEKYDLTPEMIEMFKDGRTDELIRLRSEKLIEAERSFVNNIFNE